MKTFLFYLLTVLPVMAADVKISELPAATTPSTNSWTIISDMNAVTKSQKYLITNWVLQATMIAATNNAYTSAQAFANGLTNTTVLMATNSAKSYADATFFTLGATNALAAGVTNLAKDYADSLTNTVVLMSTNAAKSYFDQEIANYLPLAGGTIAGDLDVTGTFSTGTLETDDLVLTSLTETNKLLGLGATTNAMVATKVMLTNTFGIFNEVATDYVGGDAALHSLNEAAITNALARAISGTGPLIAESDLPEGGAGIEGTVINTGVSTAGAIPVYSGTDGTNVAPSNAAIGVNAVTNLTTGNLLINGFRVSAGNVNGTITNGFRLEQAESASVGNALGIGATDLQIGRNGATKVASGTGAFAAGTNNTAGNYAMAVGNGNTAGNYSAAVGNSVNVEGTYSFGAGSGGYVAHIYSAGFGADAGTVTPTSLAIGGVKFNVQGDCQGALIIAKAKMTIATATETNLLANSSSLTLADNSTWAFDGIVVGRSSVSATTEQSVAYKISGLIERNENAASTAIIGTPTVDAIDESERTGWGVAISADTTAGALVIRVTGDTDATILWVVMLRVTIVRG